MSANDQRRGPQYIPPEVWRREGGRLGGHEYRKRRTSVTWECACGCWMGPSNSDGPASGEPCACKPSMGHHQENCPARSKIEPKGDCPVHGPAIRPAKIVCPSCSGSGLADIDGWCCVCNEPLMSVVLDDLEAYSICGSVNDPETHHYRHRNRHGNRSPYCGFVQESAKEAPPSASSPSARTGWGKPTIAHVLAHPREWLFRGGHGLEVREVRATEGDVEYRRSDGTWRLLGAEEIMPIDEKGFPAPWPEK